MKLPISAQYPPGDGEAENIYPFIQWKQNDLFWFCSTWNNDAGFDHSVRLVKWLYTL